MNFTKMRVLMTAIVLLLNVEGYAQRFYSVVFSKLPKDMQLYAREEDNTAEVPIAGVIELAGWQHMSVVTYRNNERVGYTKSVLDYGTKTSAGFDLKPRITAEIADYSFEVYACKAADSVLVVRRNEVVAGDFYVISGQSNAAAISFGAWTSKYARTIARIPDNQPNVTQGDTLWIASSWSWPYAGAWGIELQRNILEKDSIPTCVINGALPGSYIKYHNDRDANNPATPTLYGLLYSRIKVANPKTIKAFFWYQGEQEAIEDIQNYQVEYDKLFKYWQTDYPQVERFLVVQIPVLFNPYYYAGTLREFQRRTKYLYPKTEHFNVYGLSTFDGIHYEMPGYKELGVRFYQFLRPKIYGAGDSSNVACPDIQKMFFSTEKKDEITLYFEEDQKLAWPKDTLMENVKGEKFVKSLKDVFFFDGDESKPAPIAQGTASGNVVRLKLSAATNAKKLTYLPAYKGDQVAIYFGPFLKNSHGLGAFSFQEVAIADILAFTTFEAEETNMATVEVTWASPGAEQFVLQRKSEEDQDFVDLKTFDAKTTRYEDTDVLADKTYMYRIQAFSSGSESLAKTVSIKTAPILSAGPQSEMFWKIYPNPSTEVIYVDFKNAVNGSLDLLNESGQRVQNVRVDSGTQAHFNVSGLPSGKYILSLTTSDGATVSSKVLKK